jgi:hypothetical protein
MRATTALIILASNAFVAGGSAFVAIVSYFADVPLPPAVALIAIMFTVFTIYWLRRIARQINQTIG